MQPLRRDISVAKRLSLCWGNARGSSGSDEADRVTCGVWNQSLLQKTLLKSLY